MAYKMKNFALGGPLPVDPKGAKKKKKKKKGDNLPPLSSLPTPTMPSSHEELFLWNQGRSEMQTPAHFEAIQKDRMAQKMATTPLGPPTTGDMLTGMKSRLDGKLGGIPSNAMEDIRKQDPLAMDMYVRDLQANDPETFNEFYKTYSRTVSPTTQLQGKQKMAEIRKDIKMQPIKPILKNFSGAGTQEMERMIYPTGRQTAKENFNLGGTMFGASTIGAIGAAVPGMVKSFQDPNMNMGQKLGNALSAVGPLAGMIPGVGTAVGLGAGLLGNAISGIAGTINDQSAYLQEKKNTNRFGFALGGDLNQLSSEAVHVDADNPQMTDSVELPDVKVDHGEVITGDKVFSNKIVNPDTKRTFAEDEKINQKLLGNFEKMKGRSGDTEFKDDKYLKMNSEAVFNKQEQLAQMLGLRNGDGTPIQAGGMAWGGKKSKYAHGGKKGYIYGGSPGDPTNPYDVVDQILRNFTGANGGREMGLDNFGEPGDGMGLIPEDNNQPSFSLSTPIGGMKLSGKPMPPTDYQKWKQETQDLLTANFPEPEGFTNEPIVDPAPGDTYGMEQPGALLPGVSPFANSRFRTGQISPVSSIPNTIETPTFDTTPAPLESTDAPETTDTTGTQTTGTGAPGNQRPSNKVGLFEHMSETPWGSAGTAIGMASNIYNNLTLRPELVKYGRIGDRQLTQASLATQGTLAGKAEALRRAQGQGQLAMSNLSNRSLQSRAANLRNIAQGTSQAQAGITGSFADKIAQQRNILGQTITGVEGANLKTRMYQDDINTREMDAVRTERMRMQNNMRKLMIEQQFAQNHYKRNQILEKLARTKNFKFDYSSPEGIQFIQSLSADPRQVKLD